MSKVSNVYWRGRVAKFERSSWRAAAFDLATSLGAYLALTVAMYLLLGWHWEFLPSFFVKLVPGVDLVPFWTIAVVNVYRKSKREAIIEEEARNQHPALPGPQAPYIR